MKTDLQKLQNDKIVLTVSSITDSKIRCEDNEEKKYFFEICDAPTNIKEGDIVILENNKLKIDEEMTIKRKEEIEEMTKDLWQ